MSAASDTVKAPAQCSSVVHAVQSNGATGDREISVGFEALGAGRILRITGSGVKPAREPPILGMLRCIGRTTTSQYVQGAAGNIQQSTSLNAVLLGVDGDGAPRQINGLGNMDAVCLCVDGKGTAQHGQAAFSADSVFTGR